MMRFVCTRPCLHMFSAVILYCSSGNALGAASTGKSYGEAGSMRKATVMQTPAGRHERSDKLHWKLLRQVQASLVLFVRQHIDSSCSSPSSRLFIFVLRRLSSPVPPNRGFVPPSHSFSRCVFRKLLSPERGIYHQPLR
jgi:hypothetical protein